MDENKDHQLSHSEISKVLKELKVNVTDDQNDELIFHIDKSKDRQISFEEFRNFT